jgi:hypothetical protein
MYSSNSGSLTCKALLPVSGSQAFGDAPCSRMLCSSDELAPEAHHKHPLDGIHLIKPIMQVASGCFGYQYPTATAVDLLETHLAALHLANGG